MVQKILVGVDFSEHSQLVLKYAVELSKKLSADITLIHAYMLPLVNFEAGYIPPVEDMKKEAEKEMNRMLNEYVGIKFETVIRMGFPDDIIMDEAENGNFDLIIVGIAGDGFVKEKIIGSTAYSLAQKSKIPVLIITHHAEYKPIKKIVYACDYTNKLAESDLYLKVKNFVQYLGCDLEIISVVDTDNSIDTEFTKGYLFMENKLEGISHKNFFINSKNIPEGILEFIKQSNAEWLVVSPLKHSLFEKLFKESVTKQILFHSPIPVLTLHE